MRVLGFSDEDLGDQKEGVGVFKSLGLRCLSILKEIDLRSFENIFVWFVKGLG